MCGCVLRQTQQLSKRVMPRVTDDANTVKSDKQMFERSTLMILIHQTLTDCIVLNLFLETPAAQEVRNAGRGFWILQNRLGKTLLAT